QRHGPKAHSPQHPTQPSAAVSARSRSATPHISTPARGEGRAFPQDQESRTDGRFISSQELNLSVGAVDLQDAQAPGIGEFDPDLSGDWGQAKLTVTVAIGTECDLRRALGLGIETEGPGEELFETSFP